MRRSENKDGPKLGKSCSAKEICEMLAKEQPVKETQAEPPLPPVTKCETDEEQPKPVVPQRVVYRPQRVYVSQAKIEEQERQRAIIKRKEA